MDCQDGFAIRARQAARFGTEVLVWVFIFLAIVGAPLAALAQPLTPARSREVLAKAMEYQLQFRAGNMDVVPAYVDLLENATSVEPDNADLQYAMGRAYLMKGARALLPGGISAEAMPAMLKGMESLKRALQINADHPDALAQLGAVQSLMYSLMKAPAKARESVAQMNRAVQLAPDSMRVRLVRAFLGSTLPDDMRNLQAEAEDLDFIIEQSHGSRSGDYVRIMRADLDFETGKLDFAREAYQFVVDAGSPAAAADARSRLAALDKGVAPMPEIKALRSAAGAQCSMCHGRQ